MQASSRAAPTILFYVQHLLGIGHVFRATRVARELVAAGARVHLVWGGTANATIDLTGLEVIYLEPLKASGRDYAGLVTPTGEPFTPEIAARRTQQLLSLFDAVRPDVVVTETFPFGRRAMRFELEPLMRAARAASWKPLTVASIRDILQEGRKASSLRDSMDAAHAWYDLVLVHGDPSLIRIDETLPGAAELAPKIRYTGLVAPDPSELTGVPSRSAQVVVSVGGGALGDALTRAVLDAPRHSRHFPSGWLFVLGPERAQADIAAVAQAAAPGLEVAGQVPDLARVIAAARVSVSRAGYNTVSELLRTACASVLVPYAGEQQTEQLRRARTLRDHGLALMLEDAELSAPALAAAVDAAAERAAPASSFDLEGARNSARILLDAWNATPQAAARSTG